MAKKKRYILNYCKACRIDFLAAVKEEENRPHMQDWHCPECGDFLDVEYERIIWIDKFVNKKQPWTEWEDDLITYARHNGKTWQEVADALKHRSAQSARRRGQRLRKLGRIE